MTTFTKYDSLIVNTRGDFYDVSFDLNEVAGRFRVDGADALSMFDSWTHHTFARTGGIALKDALDNADLAAQSSHTGPFADTVNPDFAPLPELIDTVMAAVAFKSAQSAGDLVEIVDGSDDVMPGLRRLERDEERGW